MNIPMDQSRDFISRLVNYNLCWSQHTASPATEKNRARPVLKKNCTIGLDKTIQRGRKLLERQHIAHIAVLVSHPGYC